MAKVEFPQRLEAGPTIAAQHHLAGYILPDNAEFTYTAHQHPGNVIVSDQQEVNGKVLAVPKEFVFASRKAKAAILQKCQ